MRAALPLPERLVTLAQEFSSGAREPAEPRNAATVVLLRDGAGEGPEVYYLLRQSTMAFAAGMAVFPGGGVDPRDFDDAVDEQGLWAGPTPAQWAGRLGCDTDLARALVCAAVRETFEESGVLLAGASDSSVVADTTGDDWEADRVALEARDLSLTDFLTRRSLVLRTDLLGVWDGWTTPAFEPRRYRTWFFVAVLPEGQVTRDVSTESSQVTWLPAADAVRRADAGELALMPPTYLTSLEVAGHAGPDDVLAEAARRTVEMFTPELEATDGPDGSGGGTGWTLSVPDRFAGVLEGRS